MSTTKNNRIRCDGCGLLSSDSNGYYQRSDGRTGHINSCGFNIPNDYCDECACKLGGLALYAMEGEGNHSAPPPDPNDRFSHPNYTLPNSDNAEK